MKLATKTLLRLLALAALVVPAAVTAAAPIGVVVVKEHGAGSAAHAQEYVDELVGAVARVNQWPGAQGKYFTTRAAAGGFIAASKPHYGILSLAAFLALRGPQQLEVVGKAEVASAGGRQYHLISKNQGALAGCKGKSLASDHLDDPRFVEKVVSAGDIVLADFQVVATQRPMQTVKAVIRGEAECALIDDAQLAAMAKVEGGAAVKSVWKSQTLPPMVVVAFPSAPAAERAKFKSSLAQVCKGEGKLACDRAGIDRLVAADPGEYAGVVAAYGG